MKTIIRKPHLFLASLILCFLTIPPALAARGPIPGVDSSSKYIVYYGNDYYSDPQNQVLNYSLLNKLTQFDVVVLQPNVTNLTPAVVNYLKANGVDYVLGYISIGEDFLGFKDFHIGDGSGPVRLQNGQFVPTNGGIASFYVDIDTQLLTFADGQQTLPVGADVNSGILGIETASRDVAGFNLNGNPDGEADLNPIFKGYMVNPDASWRTLIKNMRIGATSPGIARNNVAGLDQIVGQRPIDSLQHDRTGNFGFDGFFLDTIDTAGPYSTPGWYPWTLQQMTATVQFISDTYPSKIVLANRGSFYFQAGLKSFVTNEYPIDHTIRPYINAFLFESYMYDSEANLSEEKPTTLATEYFYDNKYNQMPKVMAEANRADGFTIFTLEYAEERLLAPNETGIASQLVQNVIAEDIQTIGATPAVTLGRLLNTVDLELINAYPTLPADVAAPTWSNTSFFFIPNTANEPALNPRVGLQEAVNGSNPGDVILRWGVATDQSLPVRYVVYHNSVNDIGSAVAVELAPGQIETGDGYNQDQTRLANQVRLSGFALNQTYYFWVRAKDALGNEDSNTNAVALTTAQFLSNPVAEGGIVVDGNVADWSAFSTYPLDPDDMSYKTPAGHFSGEGNQANWKQITVAHSPTNLYMLYQNYTNIYVSWGFQVFIDTDQNTATGFHGAMAYTNPATGLTEYRVIPVGADYLIEGLNVWRYTGNGSTWSWENSSGGYELGRSWSQAYGETFLPLSWIGNPSRFDFFLFGNNEFYGASEYDWYPDGAVNGEKFHYSVVP